MGTIEWLPIAGLPDEFRDGRDLLLWDSGGPVVGRWVDTGGFGAPSYWAAEDYVAHPTHFAEVNEPS